jgi:protein-S-isoprenylcysteine O-methyltransferase Ste14
MAQDSGRFRVFLVLLAFRLLVASIVVVWSPYVILSAHPAMVLGLRVLVLAGVFLMMVGSAAYVRSAWDFAFGGRGFAPNSVVAAGVYRFMRNPMYFGLVLILLGESLLFQSWILLGYAAVLWAMLHLFVMLYEEPAMAKKLGASYQEYCKQVPRWVPRIPRGRNSGQSMT